MKTTKSIVTALIAMLAFTMASCLGDNKDNYQENAALTSYYNNITDLATGAVVNTSGVSYKLTINYTLSTIDLQMAGLKLPDGTSYPTLNLKDLPFKINSSGWMEVSAVDLQPQGFSNLNFARFNFKVIFLTLTSTMRFPLSDISFTVTNGTNTYKVYSLTTEYVAYARPKVTSDTGSVYTPEESDQSLYVYSYDPATMTASITITGAKFAEAMPAMNMKFSDIPYTISSGGVVTLACDKLVPSIVNNLTGTMTETPYPNFPISNLKGKYVPGQSMALDFVCTMLDKEGNKTAQYTVSMNTVTSVNSGNGTSAGLIEK